MTVRSSLHLPSGSRRLGVSKVVAYRAWSSQPRAISIETSERCSTEGGEDHTLQRRGLVAGAVSVVASRALIGRTVLAKEFVTTASVGWII